VARSSLLLLLALLFRSFLSAQATNVNVNAGLAPLLVSLSPASAPIGSSVTLAGNSFGATQGTSTLTVAGITATASSWSNTSVTFTVPTTATGTVVMTRNGRTSNSLTLTVTAGGAPTNPIDAARKIDWTAVGYTIPTRTQCGSTLGSASSAATIQAALDSCPANQYVQLGSGTFTLNSGLNLTHDNVTLRGQGANSTFLVFTGGGAGFYSSLIALEGGYSAAQDEANVCDFTAGYARGATTITLANCGATTPVKGSIVNLKVGGLILLDQLDEIADTGTIWNCASSQPDGQVNPCANTVQGGGSRYDGPCNGGVGPNFNGPGCLRTQQQVVNVVSCDGNSTVGHACVSGANITITPGLAMPNWSTGQKPQAWYPHSTLTGAGLEYLSVDNCSVHGSLGLCTTAVYGSGQGQNVHIASCTGCYVRGIRSVFAGRDHVGALYSNRSVIRDSYFYQSTGHTSVSYGVELNGVSDALIENNIFHQSTDSNPSCSGACTGTVVAYNFAIDNIWLQSTNWMQESLYLHAGGNGFNLWEGNVGSGMATDQVHGTHHFDTVFRNRLIGFQDAGCGALDNTYPCTLQTIPIQLYSGTRYFNLLGNVLGTAGYHTKYDCQALSTATCTNAVNAIFVLGYTNNGGVAYGGMNGYCTSPACTSHDIYDPQTPNYLMRWGNWDVFSGAGHTTDPNDQIGVRWVTGEVPSGLAVYANPVPGNHVLPSSFYRTTAPSAFTFRGLPWPGIGPDVTSGTLTNTGGHANRNPAMDCYLSVMGGPADGTGNLLAFNAATCYGP
jgi:hypothetical protein